jgi:uncharacterized protein (TIGR03546 family)
MNLLKPIFFLFDLVRNDCAPWQISFAVVLGAFLAISPTFSPQTAAVLLALCLIRVNLLVAGLSLGFFAAVTYPMQRWFDTLGHWLLVDTEQLRRFWAGLYHWPVFPFTQFNNTVVMGGLVAFAVFALPLLLASYLGYRLWGAKFISRIQQTNFALAMRSTLVFRRYAEHLLKR